MDEHVNEKTEDLDKTQELSSQNTRNKGTLIPIEEEEKTE
jgi:hypothetical protein